MSTRTREPFHVVLVPRGVERIPEPVRRFSNDLAESCHSEKFGKAVASAGRGEEQN